LVMAMPSKHNLNKGAKTAHLLNIYLAYEGLIWCQ
jgi:hypothetical protein